MRTIVFFCTLFVFPFTYLSASESTIWTIASRSDVLAGESRGVSVNDNGSITPAPRFTELFRTEQPFIWSAVADGQGNIFLGTGGEGRIYRVTPGGQGGLFADLAEMNVSAMVPGRNGELYAATSPDGKVYRINPSGSAEVYFDPKEKYIWSLAMMADGSLAVGTGENGKIFRVRSANADLASSLLFDTSETHIITLAVDRSGTLFAGTDPGGLVLRFGSDGRPFALLDSPLRELHDISFGPDGSVYALALNESISSAAPTASPTPASRTVTIERPSPNVQPTPPKSRYDLTGARTAVYRILPNGGNDIIWSSATVTGFSLFADGNGVMLGTSDKGRIYRISNEGLETLLLQSDVGQISKIFASGQNVLASSSNPGSLFRIGPERVARAEYLSPILDTKVSAEWGRLWWRSTGSVTLETRSGNTEEPGETWSGWEAIKGEGLSGRILSPGARFLQWRAVFQGPQPDSLLNEVSAAFLPRNIAPEVLSISVLPVNIGLLANPPIQIDPNIELSGMDPALFGIPLQTPPPRRVYQRGSISFQWNAEDRNGDKLVYDVFYKEVGDSVFKPLAVDLTENFFTLDGLSLPDGRYTVKVVARDSPSNPAQRALKGELISEPFSIDNTQPVVSLVGQPQIDGDSARVVFIARDSSSYLVRAEFSVNGGPWSPVYADDGLSDGPEERYTVVIPMDRSGEYSITLRVFDAAGNIGNERAIVRR